MATDVANYLNEMMLDNAFPGGWGVEAVLDNEPSLQEETMFMTRYLKNYFERVLSIQEGFNQSFEDYINEALPKFEI